MATEKKRQPGWYWVKTDDWPEADWETGEWDGHQWRVTNSETPWSPELIETVGPRIPTPDEPWQCVPKLPALEMIEASGHENSYQVGFAWQAMLAAAPKP